MKGLNVRLSVFPIHRQQQRPPAGLLLGAPRAGDTERYQTQALCSNGSRRSHNAWRSAANASSVTLTADVGG